jgi:NAD(P)-dependent dehydrogenase (short-subunit alcohol dehydrogenase family)
VTVNPLDLTGKNIIVTGASSGIGLATSRLISELGGKVAMISRNKEKLQNSAQDLVKGSYRFYPFDLSNLDEIPALVNSIREEMGPIGGLVHSAGDFAVTPLRAFHHDEYRSLYDLHVTAFFMLAQAVCSRRNVDASGASIVAVSSILANTGKEGASTYGSVKGALVSSVRSLAVEHAPKKIRFNCVCPGWVETPMLESIKKLHPDQNSFDKDVTDKHPLGLGEPNDVANAICFLLSEASRWITGISLVLDGGYSAK